MLAAGVRSSARSSSSGAPSRGASRSCPRSRTSGSTASSVRPWLHPSHRPRRVAAGSDAGAGPGADDAQPSPSFELVVPLSSPQGSQLAYILSSGDGNDWVLFDPAIETYLKELQAERDAEAAMEAEAAADAAAARAAAGAGPDAADAAEAAGAGEGASTSGAQGMDASETFDDAVLMRRIRAVREAERGQIVADILYLEAARSLRPLQLLGNLALLAPGISQPPPGLASVGALRDAQLLSPAVLDGVLSYMAASFEGGDAELMRAASPVATPLSVERVQAARLYAGLLEIGYFAAAAEAACAAAGVAVGQDSAALIAYADSLPEAELRQLCSVRSADAWWGAVRHVGTVFGLAPNDDPFDSFSLPFPDLAVTIAEIKMEPAASIWEHFSTPGEMQLAAKLEQPGALKLPDTPDLVRFELGLFQRLLLEAAVFGAKLFAAEQRIENQFGFKLSSRREREAHAGQPAL